MKNTKITDEQILTAIREGATKSKAIELRIGDSIGRKVHFLEVDRALQRCRKKGLIAYASAVLGWKVAPKATPGEGEAKP